MSTKQRGWRFVTSKDPKREGEVFIMYDDVFVMKIYALASDNNEGLAHWLVGQLRRTGATPNFLAGSAGEHLKLARSGRGRD